LSCDVVRQTFPLPYKAVGIAQYLVYSVAAAQNVPEGGEDVVW